MVNYFNLISFRYSVHRLEWRHADARVIATIVRELRHVQMIRPVTLHRKRARVQHILQQHLYHTLELIVCLGMMSGAED